MAKPDKDTLLGYVKELGLSDALAANLVQELEADEARATTFVGQRLRQSDYTRKTQELADGRRQLEAAVSSQVQDYANQLNEAQTKISKVLKDLEDEKISRTQAETRLQTLASKYEIPKEDLADIVRDNQNEPPRQNGSTPTLEAISDLIAKREEALIKRLMPDLMSYPQISNIQAEIRDQHYELTGKRLSMKEMQDIMADAGKENSGGLIKVWEDKFEIPKIRMDRHDKEVTERAIREHDEALKRKASEDAIASVHNTDTSRPMSTSPVFRKYDDRSTDGNVNGHKNGKGNGNGAEHAEPKLSGAERGAMKWVERRNQGIPLGKEAPVK